METVGLVGLGLMGSSMAQNLLRAGFNVQGYDVDAQRRDEHQERGGVVVGSPAEATDGAQIVVLSLPNGEIVREACLGEKGIVETTSGGLIILDTTTAYPQESIDTSAALAERGITFLDVSVSGTSKMAASRDLVALVGGDRDAYERAAPVIDAITRARYHLGPIGSGAKTKLIVNLVLGLERIALAEGLVIGERAGMDLEVLLEVLKDSVAGSKVMHHYGPRMVAGDHFPPTGRLRQHGKDVSLMLRLGRDEGAPVWLTSVMAQVIEVGKAMGLADADSTSTVEVLRRLAGLGRIDGDHSAGSAA